MDLKRYGVVGGQPLSNDLQNALLKEGASELPSRDSNGMFLSMEVSLPKKQSVTYRDMRTAYDQMEKTLEAHERFERSIRELDTRKRPFYSRSTMAKMVQNAIDKLHEDLNAILRYGDIKHGG